MNKFVSTAVNNTGGGGGGVTSATAAGSSQRENLFSGASSNKGIGRIARGEYDKFSPIR
jgi:hypothetical protein